MNAGQEKFYHFILERVMEEHKSEAEELLKQNFQKQEAGSFGLADMIAFGGKITGWLKPECVEEVKAVMEQFRSGHGGN